MGTVGKVIIVVLIILVAAVVALYLWGIKLQKKQALQKEQMDAMAQTVSMLIIDKKRMKITESGLPQAVIDSTPKYMRRAKLPIVKAKIGPKVMTLACEESVFQQLPVKREAKVVVSGIYITAVKSARGGLETPPAKKQNIFQRMLKRAQKTN